MGADVADGPVELWSTDVARLTVGRVAELERRLDAEEREQARSLRHPDAREAFVVGRGLLRVLLARRLGVTAEEVGLVREPLGRLRLSTPTVGEDVRFSVSRSGRMVLHAFASQRNVGVDVERIRERPGLLQVADRFFAPGERRTLDRLSADERLAAFFVLWTQKEAYLKALGVGLLQPLDAFELSPTIGQQRLLQPGPNGETKAWSLVAFSPAPGYAGAVAVEASAAAVEPQLRRFVVA